MSSTTSEVVRVPDQRAKLFLSLHHRARMSLFMLLADLFALGIASGLVLLSNEYLGMFILTESDFKYAIVPLLCLVLFINSQLYPSVGISPAEEIKLVTRHTSTGFIVGIIFLIIIHGSWRLNLLAYSFAWCLFILVVLFARWGVRIVSIRLGLWGEPVAILANDSRGGELTCYFCQRARLGFRPVVVMADTVGLKCAKCPLPIIKPESLLQPGTTVFAKRGVQTVLVADSSAVGILASETNKKILQAFKHVIFISDMDWLEDASIRIHDFEGLLGMESQKNTLNFLDSFIKRGIDIVLALLLGVATLPLMLFVAILIRMDSAGPIFYSQQRLGKNGRHIRIYKFRSMVMNADTLLKDYLETHPVAREEWQHTQKLRDDPRITRVGDWLRKFSIDELPQLFNVLKGDLSLVGPRPIVKEEVLHYQDRIDVYQKVRPGLTGLWQVSGRNHTSYKERVHYDVYYVRNWSVWLDIYILFRTVWVVLKKQGAY